MIGIAPCARGAGVETLLASWNPEDRLCSRAEIARTTYRQMVRGSEKAAHHSSLSGSKPLWNWLLRSHGLAIV